MTAAPGEPSPRQRLAAILAADAAGCSRLMEADERATLAAPTADERHVAERVRVARVIHLEAVLEFDHEANRDRTLLPPRSEPA